MRSGISLSQLDDGTVSTGSYDLVPLLEDFIQEHPDFSYRGDRAVFALTASLRLWCLLVKIREQLQLGKVLIGHRTELRKGAVGQLPQFRFLRGQLAAHLTQAVDQSGAAD